MSELSDLRWRQNQKISEKNQCERRIADIDGKLRRLEAAKRSLSGYKSEAKSKKKNAAKIPEALTPWEGNKRNSYSNNADLLDSSMEGYYKACDRALDAVCDAITSLENERSNQYGLLGHLISAINSIGNEIEKFLN